ncbi:hypothetical protein [Alsobacter sp. SYSU BS001988]
MPWITAFMPKPGVGRKQPTQVVAQVKAFDVQDGRTVLQIDTYGSDDRVMRDKQSQTFQMGEEAARQLFDIIKNTYRF